MVKFENDCVDCGQPCLGNDCPNRNVKHLYCDKCKFECSVLYKYDGQEFCHDCLLENFETIEE